MGFDPAWGEESRMTHETVEVGIQDPVLSEGPEWAAWSDEQLLQLRLCDLRLSIEGSPVIDQIQALYSELAAHEVVFRPHFWFSNEWFSPAGMRSSTFGSRM